MKLQIGRIVTFMYVFWTANVSSKVTQKFSVNDQFAKNLQFHFYINTNKDMNTQTFHPLCQNKMILKNEQATKKTKTNKKKKQKNKYK